MTCDDATKLVSGYAFSDVRPVKCSGRAYEFEATREGNGYSIEVSAADGKLISVTKHKSTSP